jgi:hypothetical protein
VGITGQHFTAGIDNGLDVGRGLQRDESLLAHGRTPYGLDNVGIRFHEHESAAPQLTALVNEAYLRLKGVRAVRW